MDPSGESIRSERTNTDAPRTLMPPHCERCVKRFTNENSQVYELPIAESRLIDESGGHEAYGELTTRGVREVVKRLAPQEDDVICDLGSGCGRMVIQCALEWPLFRAALGVELSPTRHAAAVTARSRDPLLLRKVKLVEEDMMKADLRDGI